MRNKNGYVHLFITLKLSSTFRRIGKAVSIKMTAKAVGINSSSHLSIKN